MTTLDTIIIYTTDVERLSAFYEEGLDILPFEKYSDDHVGQSLGAVYFGFDKVEEVTGQPGGVRLWFTVDNLQTTFDRFLSLGAEVEFQPKVTGWGRMLAAVRDPDGNVVGLAAPSEDE